jgi:hypothetical protein
MSFERLLTATALDLQLTDLALNIESTPPEATENRVLSRRLYQDSIHLLFPRHQGERCGGRRFDCFSNVPFFGVDSTEEGSSTPYLLPLTFTLSHHLASTTSHLLTYTSHPTSTDFTLSHPPSPPHLYPLTPPHTYHLTLNISPSLTATHQSYP